MYLFFQSGHRWDEAEHAHVAWLISQGKRPLVDFFQHHQPLLWNLMTPYYSLGFTGAGVMFWGRSLVVCSALIVVVSLYRWGHWIGIALFIALMLGLPDLFVIRPETISAALFMMSFTMWNRAESVWALRLAGVAMGAAVYGSPRFALLGACFLLSGRQSVRRWICLTAGAVGFVAIYTIVARYPLSQVVFNIRFSAHMQHIGELESDRGAMWLTLMVTTCAPAAVLIVALERSVRLRASLWVAYALAVYVACDVQAGGFRYPQAYSPYLLLVALVAGWILQRVIWDRERIGRIAITGAALLFAVGATLLWPSRPLPPMNLIALVHARDALAMRIPPDRAVLLYTIHSPITRSDISYYGNPLADSQDRLCTAVRTFSSAYPLPNCDFLAELAKRPYVTEVDFRAIIPPQQTTAADKILQSDYRSEWTGPLIGRIAILKSASP